MNYHLAIYETTTDNILYMDGFNSSYIWNQLALNCYDYLISFKKFVLCRKHATIDVSWMTKVNLTASLAFGMQNPDEFYQGFIVCLKFDIPK